MKPCRKCGGTDRTSYGACRVCDRERRVAYRAANKEAIKDNRDKWREKNKEKLLEQGSAWKEANKEKMVEWYKAYNEYHGRESVIEKRTERKNATDKNSEQYLKAVEIERLKGYVRYQEAKEQIKSHYHKLRKFSAAVENNFRSCDVIKIIVKQQGLCVYCKVDITEQYHIDHIIPITKNGLNNIENIQVLCPTCNLIKADMLEDDFLKSTVYKHRLEKVLPKCDVKRYQSAT